ncbi:MAG TPA: PIN domain-containing protein, partial [Castellaniella sp.]|nr:PIN domain-containing protein [Castellaniella sp.]
MPLPKPPTRLGSTVQVDSNPSSLPVPDAVPSKAGGTGRPAHKAETPSAAPTRSPGAPATRRTAAILTRAAPKEAPAEPALATKRPAEGVTHKGPASPAAAASPSANQPKEAPEAATRADKTPAPSTTSSTSGVPAARPKTKAQPKRLPVAQRKLFVLDTNVLLHDSTSLFRFAEHDVFLPMIVLEELDHQKKGMSEVARNARQVSRYLDGLIGTAELTKGVPLD